MCRALHEKMCKTFVVYSVLLTVNVDVHQRVQHWLHELVGERAEVVVEELDPLEAVEVLEGGGRDVADPKGKKQEQSLFRRMRFIMKRAGKSQKSTAATLSFRALGPKKYEGERPLFLAFLLDKLLFAAFLKGDTRPSPGRTDGFHVLFPQRRRRRNLISRVDSAPDSTNTNSKSCISQ